MVDEIMWVLADWRVKETVHHRPWQGMWRIVEESEAKQDQQGPQLQAYGDAMKLQLCQDDLLMEEGARKKGFQKTLRNLSKMTGTGANKDWEEQERQSSNRRRSTYRHLKTANQKM
jgi:hypothetical protein